MQRPLAESAPTPADDSTSGDQLPAGGLGAHPVEVAAAAGFGPLSPLVSSVWHGDSRPCVSCGRLIRRNAQKCDACGQDHSPEMIARMEAHAGPWHVLDPIRPFPGVTLERLVRQVHRGVVRPFTIVKGPSTNHQWRYAAEVPELALEMGICAKCQARLGPQMELCPACGQHYGTEDADASTISPEEVPPECLALAEVVQNEAHHYTKDLPSGEGNLAMRIAVFACVLVLLGVMFLLIALKPSGLVPTPPPESVTSNVAETDR